MPIKKNENDRIDNIVIYIDNNLGADLSVEALAKKCHYSTYHFHRIFREHTGESVHAYVVKSRISHACNLLINTDHSVQYISEICGYKSKSMFYKQFKNMHGVTPSEYKCRFVNTIVA